VGVRLQYPAAAKMSIAALWHVTLTNPGEARQVMLFGFAHDSKGQLVGDGLTSIFTLPKGITIVSAPMVEPVSYSEGGGGYDEIIKRTGVFPNGVYTFCVYVIDAKDTRDTIGRDCISDHAIFNVSSIQLIHPNDEAFVLEKLPLFSWIPISPLVPVDEVTYKLRIVEKLPNQSAYDALQSNREWFVEDDITPSIFAYPLSANTLEPNTYAWQIIAYANTLDAGRGELVRSEARTFTVEEKKSDSVVVVPTDTVNLGLSHRDTVVEKSGDSTTLHHEPTLTQHGGDSLHMHKVSQLDSTRVPQVGEKPTTGVCANLKTKFEAVTSGDTITYALSITNSFGGADSVKPKIFRITVKGDSVASISGNGNKNLSRTPSKFPPGTSVVKWASVDYLPMGESKLGTVKFQHSRSSRPVRFEWLDRDSNVICADSTTLGESNFYYELSDDPSNAYIEVPNDNLHVQYNNSYASSNDLALSIFDPESQTLIASKANKRGVDSKSRNGVNKIAVPLKDYGLTPGKNYILSISGAKSTYLLNFSVAKTK
jgi:hypothetical protein